MITQMSLEVPNANTTISPGDKIQIGRFDSTVWLVRFGWYSFGGNRAVCGWYLQSENQEVKPIFKIDLDDIYIIEKGGYIGIDDLTDNISGQISMDELN